MCVIKYRHWLVLHILIISLMTLGCSTSELPTISIGQPISFMLMGEVSHEWKTQVVSGKTYEVIVTRQDGTHPVNRIAIIARGGNWTVDNRPQVQGDNAILNFSASESGNVVITIVSTVGMNGENLGKHNLEIREVK